MICGTSLACYISNIPNFSVTVLDPKVVPKKSHFCQASSIISYEPVIFPLAALGGVDGIDTLIISIETSIRNSIYIVF